ncbi:MAG: TetR/AcrR family transcriptional regulator [Pseudomonadota bacterium]|uniref:TetR/AcrR family transcriptional regulator n=1 Tax=Phenylobacterium sp. Root700 TaxID=1736591 RepID=UPI0006F7866C|nr:TetR family transcriptional regulator [Phenylobacterium sp. Root700]MBT9469856.1 TetR/AcrR family transcriptional regulator [Phenylobacterium sp.]
MKTLGRDSAPGVPAVSAEPAEPSRRPARDRIFETARDMFYRRGIRAVGVESIAAEAGATKMSLYRNFPSKDQLVAEVLREQSREGWAWWDEVVAAFDTPREKLEGLFEAFANKSSGEEAQGCALCNAAVELHEPDHPAFLVAQEHKRETHRRLIEMSRAAGAQDDELGDGLMLLLEGSYMARVTLSNDGPARMLPRTARALIREYLDQ